MPVTGPARAVASTIVVESQGRVPSASGESVGMTYADEVTPRRPARRHPPEPRRPRAVIYQALGVIMAQERCTQAKAFEILRTASQNTNLKLRDVAAAIVTSVSGEPPQPHPFEENGD